MLLTEPVEIRRRAKDLLRQAGRRPGHIFNLGHGVLPQTPLKNVLALVEAVRESSSRMLAERPAAKGQIHPDAADH